MTATQTEQPPINLMFGHMGISVSDIGKMEDFYTRILGFTVTDRGDVGGLKLVFLSRDPRAHHQIALATGRPEVMPENTLNDQFGPSINQISFKLATIADIRYAYQRLVEYGCTHILPANHGIAWTLYAHDPEGNNLEFFVDTPWYMLQPFLVPLDLSKTDEELFEATREMCEKCEGFKPYSEWRAQITQKMHRFVPAA